MWPLGARVRALVHVSLGLSSVFARERRCGLTHFAVLAGEPVGANAMVAAPFLLTGSAVATGAGRAAA